MDGLVDRLVWSNSAPLKVSCKCCNRKKMLCRNHMWAIIKKAHFVRTGLVNEDARRSKRGYIGIPLNKQKGTKTRSNITLESPTASVSDFLEEGYMYISLARLKYLQMHAIRFLWWRSSSLKGTVGKCCLMMSKQPSSSLISTCTGERKTISTAVVSMQALLRGHHLVVGNQ